MSRVHIETTPNSLAANLSPDLLYFIARSAYSETFIECRPGSRGSFIGMTRVCRHWRYTLLSYPLLWTNIHIPQRSIGYLKDILTRSANCPLHVIINLECPSDIMARQFNVVFAHLSRIRSLIFRQQTYTYHEPILNYIFQYINKSAPMLEVFHFDLVTCVSHGWCHPDVKLRPGGHIAETLFADHTPNLREFHVSSMKIPRHMSILKTITRLSLKHVYGLSSPDHLLDILEAACSNLESLELVFEIDYSWIFPTETFARPTILLSSMRTLLLNVGPEVLTIILNHTDIPPTVSWTIDCGDLISRSLDMVPFTTLFKKLRKGAHINFTIEEKQIHVKFRDNLSDHYHNFFKLRVSSDRFLRRLQNILVNIGLSDVHSCELIIPQKTRLPGWLGKYEENYQGFFFLFDQIEKLSIACETSKQLQKFIRRLEPRMIGGHLTVPCPLLSDLKVGLVTITSGSLIQFVTARKEAGHVLTNLHVDYDNRVKDIIFKPELMELVQNVEFFGKNILVAATSHEFVAISHLERRISYTQETIKDHHQI
ncbi:hypothetical protein Clacol_000137 [Clathrus columnatus]|uniref:F-box domain-containing protein n=1 Tax=Clathrus columnatus TaxID=1419009 RepID=A0AAV5A231_9AGAM|nr:hypothetical protein Clacol_000137 [Clathrus columnatus]